MYQFCQVIGGSSYLYFDWKARVTHWDIPQKEYKELPMAMRDDLIPIFGFSRLNHFGVCIQRASLLEQITTGAEKNLGFICRDASYSYFLRRPSAFHQPQERANCTVSLPRFQIQYRFEFLTKVCSAEHYSWAEVKYVSTVG